MTRRRMLFAIACWCLISWLPLPGGEQKQAKSALDSNPSGWIDLLADADLKNWMRVSIPPKSKLSAKNPWSVSADGKALICDGVGIHEMLLWEKEVADGIFHVEWRFKKLDDKKGYNSGVYVRNSADGAIWHQAQVGSKNVGYLFGSTLVDGAPKRMNIGSKVPQRGKEAGAWNTFEITCKGKTISLWVNGATTCTWDDCRVEKGRLGMEAEGWYIEFKNVKFKAIE